MFAGFPKWPKGVPDNGNGAAAAAVSEETEKGRAMSWIGTMVRIGRFPCSFKGRGEPGIGPIGVSNACLACAMAVGHLRLLRVVVNPPLFLHSRGKSKEALFVQVTLLCNLAIMRRHGMESICIEVL